LGEKISVTANVKADKNKVWDYYVNPEYITKWNFADPSWHCPSASNDMRPGGKYTARMEARDGSFGFDFEAIYDEISEGEKFTYTLGDGRVVNVNFKNENDYTEVTVRFDPEMQNPVDMQRDGWQAILNNFKKFTEEN